MGPIDFAVIGIVLVIVALAAWYVIRAKKRGAKCIGCPSGGNCAGSCTGKTGADGVSCGCGSCASCEFVVSSGEGGEVPSEK